MAPGFQPQKAPSCPNDAIAFPATNVQTEDESCTTPSSGTGRCISLYDCSELLSIVNKPNKSHKELDTLRRSSCGFDGSTPKVCCPTFEQSDQSNLCFTPDGQQGECINLHSCNHIANFLKPPVSQDSITFVQNSRCETTDPYSVCCGPPPDLSFKPNTVCNGQPGIAPPDPASGCCGQHVALPDRIIGGTETGVDEYPWLVLIEYSKNNKIKLLCGGALISDRYVLTAGHCVVGAVLRAGTPRNVRLGEYDTSNDVSQADCIPASSGGDDCTKGPVIIPIEKVIPHPDYKPQDTTTRRHDIALIRMRESAPYTEFIRPICLPTSDVTLTPPVGWQMIAAGWGAVNETHSKSNVKLDVQLPFVSYSDCQPVYAVPRRKVDLWQGQMCAGGEEGKDSCKGDSGGPLMWENPKGNKFFEVVGIVSFGPTPCGMENVPGVYTKVYQYNPWIRQTIRP
ncbi:phenoloxidase-activating enzyme-like [Hyposmocoma kahamanoa]|uniref:phenoloxidase-activating enzyme-like n=1 Tax=Hyposmocoma kahamanoa TaxID=1477025 RepID=UPI000E6D8509|nr:phenoloxidase-activating enzyme-like [Hyposmocoma kahamanoa]